MSSFVTGSDIIAKLFNDASYNPVYSFAGVVEDIDTARPPVANRDGPFLKRQYQNARKRFSMAYHNWSKSGQNDPDLFSRFTVLRRDETLTPEGEKTLVFFHVLWCGSKFLDRALMDCIYRRIGGSCRKGFESGAGVDNVEPRQKRRRSASASQSDDLKSMKKIVNYATTQWSKSVAESAHVDQRSTENVQDDVDRTICHVNKLSELTQALSKAEEMSKSGPEEAREVWKKIYAGVLCSIITEVIIYC